MLMIFSLLFLALMLALHAFFFLGSKSSKWEGQGGTCFECGFSGIYSSRESFPIHFFTVALTFLMLDLELCLLMPLFSSEAWQLKAKFFFLFFFLTLTLGVLVEWKNSFLDWKF